MHLAKRPAAAAVVELEDRAGRHLEVRHRAIRFTEHLTGDGPTVFAHVCRMGLEGIVSKRTDAPYHSGRSRTWLKSKNPASAAVRRERGVALASAHPGCCWPVIQSNRLRWLSLGLHVWRFDTHLRG